MARSAGEFENQLHSAGVELPESDWTTVVPQLADPSPSAGLNHLRRRLVLAASDPLMADLILTLDLLDDAVVLLHEDGRLIHCNHAASALAAPAKISAIPSLHVLGPDEPWAACRQILREYQKSPCNVEREAHDPGTGKCWELRLTALAYLGVVPRRLVLVVRDVSEAVRTRELLKDREVMADTGALLAGAAHQAKNAIFGLSATLDAFEERVKTGAAEDEYFDNLRDGIARMQTLMRDLLDYATPSAQHGEPVSMAAVMRQSVSECRTLAVTMQVTLALQVAEDGEVVVRSARLARAMENLLENAIQHSRSGGTVTVRLSRVTLGERALLRCDVIDQGPGFPPEHMERLFTPFFTLRPGGTGLGLTIAKRIIEDAGGMIRLSNTTAGGAEVSVWLPMHEQRSTESRNRSGECESGAK